MWVTLFEAPYLKGHGEVPNREVLRVLLRDGKPVEYVVHTQYVSEKGEVGYEQGHYYLVSVHENAFERAMDKFWERVRNKYHSGTESSIVMV